MMHESVLVCCEHRLIRIKEVKELMLWITTLRFAWLQQIFLIAESPGIFGRVEELPKGQRIGGPFLVTQQL